MANFSSQTIADLKTINKEDLTSTSSLFLMSQGDSALSSYKFNYETLSSTLKTNLAYMPLNWDSETFNPEGIWRFSETSQLKSEFNNSLPSSNRQELAINISAIYVNYIKKLIELSSLYFAGNGVKNILPDDAVISDELFIPSYIGQIIVSSKLSSESALQDIYGKETKWTKISGRLLVGVGDAGRNLNDSLGETEDITFLRPGLKGGSPYVSIGDFVPMHSHCMANGYNESHAIARVHTDDSKIPSHSTTLGTLKGKLEFGQFPAANYKFFAFNCKETKGKSTEADDENDKVDEGWQGDAGGNGGVEGGTSNMENPDFKGTLALSDGEVLNVRKESQHHGKRFLANAVGHVRTKTQNYFKTFTYKVMGKFLSVGKSEDEIALMPALPACLVYYIWERIE